MCTKLDKEKLLFDRLPITETPNDAATRNADAARTLDGRVPVDRPYVWICPRRPTIAVPDDDAINRYYCPECDWCDYYCLCSTLKTVGPCNSRLLALEQQREKETGLVGYTVDRNPAGGRGRGRRTGDDDDDRQSTVLCRTTWPDVDDGASSAGRHTLQSAGRGVGAGQGGTVAVDEGGDGGSTEQTLEGAKSMATTGQRDDADGSDAGGSCRRRTRDVLLRVEDLVNAGCEDDNEAEFSDDEELELFLKAYDEGQVRICCEWTAAALTSEGADGGGPYTRKVAVWKRPWAEAPAANKRRKDDDDSDDAMDDDDDEDLTRALDDWEQREEDEVNEQQQEERREEEEGEATKETPASPPPPPDDEKTTASSWKTPRNVILYTTRRWELVPRASKRLEAKEHARWVARAQQSIDAEDEWRRRSEELGIDEKLAELRRTPTTSRKRKKTKTTTAKKRLTPRSKLLATGRERGTAARRNLAKLDFK